VKKTNDGSFMKRSKPDRKRKKHILFADIPMAKNLLVVDGGLVGLAKELKKYVKIVITMPPGEKASRNIYTAGYWLLIRRNNSSMIASRLSSVLSQLNRKVFDHSRSLQKEFTPTSSNTIYGAGKGPFCFLLTADEVFIDG